MYGFDAVCVPFALCIAKLIIYISLMCKMECFNWLLCSKKVESAILFFSTTSNKSSFGLALSETSIFSVLAFIGKSYWQYKISFSTG